MTSAPNVTLSKEEMESLLAACAFTLARLSPPVDEEERQAVRRLKDASARISLALGVSPEGFAGAMRTSKRGTAG